MKSPLLCGPSLFLIQDLGEALRIRRSWDRRGARGLSVILCAMSFAEERNVSLSCRISIMVNDRNGRRKKEGEFRELFER